MTYIKRKIYFKNKYYTNKQVGCIFIKNLLQFVLEETLPHSASGYNFPKTYILSHFLKSK